MNPGRMVRLDPLNIAKRQPAALKAYADGSGGDSGGYGYFIPRTGESEYVGAPGATNNQAEYLAVLAVLERFAGSGEPLVIYSDSQVVVRQINHEYGINDPKLRDLAREVWRHMPRDGGVEVRWVPRRENPAGKMLGG